MRALTLHGCWAWAVAHAGKDIENRVWPVPPKHLGTRIAIHAGSNPGSQWARENIALASTIPLPAMLPKACIVATALVSDCVEESDSPWFEGRYGWVLSNVQTLRKPVPCAGALGLWIVKPPLDKLVALAWERTLLERQRQGRK